MEAQNPHTPAKMQKMFQWIREKRHSTVRKWQSSAAFNGEDSNNDMLNDFDKFVATSTPSLASDKKPRSNSSFVQSNGRSKEVPRRKSEHPRHESRPSSKSFKSFPPVPIPKKSRRNNETNEPSGAVNVEIYGDPSQRLQVPSIKREGSWRKLKRKLTSRKKGHYDVGDAGMTQPLLQPTSSTNSNCRDADSIDSISQGQFSGIPGVEVGDRMDFDVRNDVDDTQRDIRQLLIEDDSSQLGGSHKYRPSNASLLDSLPSTTNPAIITPSDQQNIKTNQPFASTRSSTPSSQENDEPEPYIQLANTEVDFQCKNSSQEMLLQPEKEDVEIMVEKYPEVQVMSSAMTQSAYASTAEPRRAIPPEGSMSVRTTRKLRFQVPQVSVYSVDDIPSTFDKNRTHSMGDMSSSSSQTAVLAHAENANSSRRVTLPDADYDDNLMPGKSSECSRPVSSTPTSPVPSPLAPRRGMTDIERRRASLAMRRQSNVQLVQKACGRRTSTTLIPLTSAQIHLVRSLWRQIYLTKGPTVIGTTVIHRLFFKCPKVKEQFRNCPMPRCFSNHDSFAKQHCKAMAELVDQVVENLDDLESVVVELQRIGRIHAQLLSGQLSSKIWNAVAETFIDCTLEWGDRRCRSETVRKAWALIIAFMVEKIKHGHLEERKQLLVMRSTIAGLERVALAASSTATATANIRT